MFCIFYVANRRKVDNDNLIKGIKDALSGVVYGDDHQVWCEASIRIVDKERPRSVVEISKVESGHNWSLALFAGQAELWHTRNC